MSVSTLPARIQECVEMASGKWQDATGLEEETLLRMAILRDIMREIHGEKSRLLASGARADAQALKEWEKRIEELRGAASYPADIREAIEGRGPVRRRTRLLPEALHQFIEKEKFDRYDRAWETALAAEASSLGWRFWALDAWVGISEAEAWHRTLSTRLLPHGVLLFVEAAPEGPDSPGASPRIWKGRWIVILKPRFLTPDFRVREIPGTSLEPSPPAWKLLFSPKQR